MIRMSLYRFLWMSMLLSLLCVGCGGEASRPVVRPTATIAVAALAPAAAPVVPSPTPQPSPTVAQPTATAPIARSEADATQFEYLWPAYIPEAMQLSPDESRVAQSGEVGANSLGFYLVTFNGEAQKLVIGGGSIEHFPIGGVERRITVGSRTATFTSDGEQRQIVFDQAIGQLFVYGFGVGEEELLRVAESLQLVALNELQQRVAEPTG